MVLPGLGVNLRNCNEVVAYPIRAQSNSFLGPILREGWVESLLVCKSNEELTPECGVIPNIVVVSDVVRVGRGRGVLLRWLFLAFKAFGECVG